MSAIAYANVQQRGGLEIGKKYLTLRQKGACASPVVVLEVRKVCRSLLFVGSND
jgi:hypothetical protein